MIFCVFEKTILLQRLVCIYLTKKIRNNAKPYFFNWVLNYYCTVYFILFQTKVNFENDGDLYSACSNPTIVVLVIVLGIISILGALKLIGA
jgi:hypothetical protein